jgi:serine/threonine-protein phosphatase PGAM5
MAMLYLVRHAEQDVTEDEDPGVGISALGREQARRLGERLRDVPFDGIHHGPLLRAEQTATAIADAAEATVAVKPSAHLQDRTPIPAAGEENAYSASARDWLTGVPVAEQDSGGAQISAALDHFAALEGHHLLVTHAFVVGWMVRSALGAPIASWLGLSPFNAGLTVLRCRPEHPENPVQLVSYNDLGHLN